MINAERLKDEEKCDSAQFSRSGIIDDEAVGRARYNGRLYAYICDFPSNLLKDHPRCITLPSSGRVDSRSGAELRHHGCRSTQRLSGEWQYQEFSQFSEHQPAQKWGYRIAVVNSNVPNMVGQISTDLAEAGLNIVDMLNRSRAGIAVTLMDTDKEPPAETLTR